MKNRIGGKELDRNFDVLPQKHLTFDVAG